MYSKILGGLLIALAIVIVISVAYHNSHKSQQPIVFSDRNMLDGLWHYHQLAYIDLNNFRTVDHSRDDASTSEGQGYAMLRAVWWNDKDAFDKSWNWTKDNLQHKSGNVLFSWYYSKLPNGNFGVDQSIGGQNTASDADTDIALALIFANDRWQDPKYLDAAKAIVGDIWTNEVGLIKAKPVLFADNLEKTSALPYAVVNPSYFAPYAYKIFAKYDPQHDWNGLVTNSYSILNQAMDAKLDKQSSAELPPDWIQIDKTTGVIKASTSASITTNYSFDAIRTPFRLTLDWLWFQDSRAKEVLSKMSFLTTQWQSKQTLYSTYQHDGSAVNNQESPAAYGGDIGYFMVVDPINAKSVYDNKLKVLYTPDTDSWKQQLSYYDDNWAWLGMALYNNFLINLDQK